MLKLFDDFDNMFRQMDAMFNYPLSCDTTKNRGLRSRIKKPHNLITNRDKDGKVTGYSIETVYTPFSKDDVKVEVKNNVLTVKCGKENKIKDENMDYCGVSYQSYEFSLPLSESVDMSKISAKADDGMLRIDIPVKEELPNKDVIQIEVK